MPRRYFNVARILFLISTVLPLGFASASLNTSSNSFDVGSNLGFLKFYLDKKADSTKKGLGRFYDRIGIYSLSVLDASDFVRPNERNPQDSVNILNLAPPGIYLSVGSERGFIGATLAPNTTHILLVDRDPKVYIFNRLNILLLTMAYNRKDYMFLRFQAGHEQILARARQLNLNSEDIEFLGHADTFHFLHFLVRNPFFLRPLSIWAPFSSVAQSTHYMNNSIYFDRLSKLAKSGRIKSVVGDLSSNVDLEKINSVVDEWESRISVLDISNAWVSTHINKKTKRTVQGYMSEADLKTLIQKISTISSPEGILLLTNLDRKYGSIKQVWNYYGIKIADIEKHSHTESWNALFPGGANLGLKNKNNLNPLTRLNSNQTACQFFYRAVQ